ncbi:hypothetical protein ENUP19_0328G0048 [Entamoeba nuttalli]|uniref:Uncharacterized protein n=1 Tax=Entamoeba nuttalli TaxID=412467 RepID=A0ABQ0DWW4_9EUKA
MSVITDHSDSQSNETDSCGKSPPSTECIDQSPMNEDSPKKIEQTLETLQNDLQFYREKYEYLQQENTLLKKQLHFKK